MLLTLSRRFNLLGREFQRCGPMHSTLFLKRVVLNRGHTKLIILPLVLRLFPKRVKYSFIGYFVMVLYIKRNKKYLWIDINFNSFSVVYALAVESNLPIKKIQRIILFWATVFYVNMKPKCMPRLKQNTSNEDSIRCNICLLNFQLLVDVALYT